MLALAVEFSFVVAWFLWLHLRQVRDRSRTRRMPLRQMSLPLGQDGRGSSFR